MGVDIGSASSKAVILKDGKDVLAAEVVQVGTGSTGPKKAMEMAFEKSGVKEEEIDFIIATGYGRFSLEDADKQMSEISCHAKGIYHVPSLISAVRMRKRSDWITRVVLSSFL